MFITEINSRNCKSTIAYFIELVQVKNHMMKGMKYNSVVWL